MATRHKAKLTVSGYIKQNFLMLVPEDVINLCIIFYFVQYQLDESKIERLCQRLQSRCKDERFLAVSGIIEELKKVGFVSDSMQKIIQYRIVTRHYSALFDYSDHVQTAALQCLCIMVKLFSAERIQEMIDKLTNYQYERWFDVNNKALNNIICLIPKKKAQLISRKLFQILLKELNKKQVINDFWGKSAKHYCLNNMKHLISRFGDVLSNIELDAILQTVRSILDIQVASSECHIHRIINDAIDILGDIVGFVNDKTVNNLMHKIISKIKIQRNDLQNEQNETLIRYIRTINVLVTNHEKKHYFLLHFKDSIMLLFIKICTDKNITTENNEYAINVLMYCVETLDVMIQCSQQPCEYIDNLISMTLILIAYDPGYDFMDLDTGDDALSVDDDAFDDDNGWDDDNNDDWCDDWNVQTLPDNDSSWKVRQIAIKFLIGLMKRYKSEIKHFHVRICELLLDRFFKEYDIDVMLLIFTAFKEFVLMSIIAEQSLVLGYIHECINKYNSITMPIELEKLCLLYVSNTWQLISQNLYQKILALKQKICSRFDSNKAKLKIKNGLLSMLADLILICHNDGIKKYFDELTKKVNTEF